MVFEKSEWIWHGKDFGENEYSEFTDTFEFDEKKTVMRISVCGDYTLFINGKYVESNQYADFAHYKVYDEIDITKFLVKGRNTVCFLVWYFGKSGMRYNTPNPGLIYEIKCGDTLAAYSGENTYSRLSPAYHNGKMRKITPQLGYGFSYDFTKENDWLSGNLSGFENSHIIAEKANFYKRPVKKLNVCDMSSGKPIQTDDGYLFDFGEETVGYPTFSVKSEYEQNVNISYGEKLINGHVPRIIDMRDFSVDCKLKKGDNRYTNHMFRFACRYVEIKSEFPIDIEYMGILPVSYPAAVKNVDISNPLDRKIYDICLNTLRLCMLEHYIDCPWREQCLYAFDSRNQMLTGYYAYKDGNFDYARSNLLLMSKDNREDGLLSICFPSAEDLTIPSFSLYYIISVKEYIDYSGDVSLGVEVFEKMTSILQTFTDNMSNNLVCRFNGNNKWNFYDWSPNAIFGMPDENFNTITEELETDFLLNCIMVMALDAYDDVCGKLSRENIFNGISDKIRIAAKNKFFNKSTGFFFVNDSGEKAAELANSLAVLSEIATGETAEKICCALVCGEMIPCSLSMKIFKYDALLKIDSAKYKENILDEIRSQYKKMLDYGSTTVWEMIERDEFDNAASLCHGWSAIPIYCYNKMFFGEVRNFAKGI